jgi:tetratricopeptide (TPR) repeat protein
MPKQILAFLFLLIGSQSFAQGYKADFEKLLTEKDTAAQWRLLHTWQKANPQDAELFIAYFNYYFFSSRKEVIAITDSTNEPASLEIRDSADLHTIGYLSEDFDYDSTILEKAFQCLDTGINTWPSRLDMRFGKIYALGQIENYEAYTNEIIHTIEVGNQLKHKWVWANNQPVNEPERVLLGTIQDYVAQLYNAGDDQLTRMRRIAQAVLKYYPRHVESLSNLAITYGLQGDYDKALDALLQAEKIMPGDVIVLNNIATMYERKGDKLNAIKYLELTAKHGDKDTKNAAVRKLKELKN